tara:strand:+ start:4391 stop:5173 length:783 start_codon:yes stop_codon:yes gene_type:complete
MNPILSVRGLNKHYLSGFSGFKRQYLHALKDVSFDLSAGETLAIVGETSSGKSTLARILAGADAKTSGEIFFEEQPLESYPARDRCSMIRMIFQNANSSLNPNLRIGQLLEEPLLFSSELPEETRLQMVYESLNHVGLLPEHAQFYPHMISSGQRQRVCVARAIMLRPKIIIADGALSTLDVLVRAQIIQLLRDLKRVLNISFILVSHDLHIIRHISDRIAILAQGEIIEIAPSEELFKNPQQDYTKTLLKEQSTLFKKQ